MSVVDDLMERSRSLDLATKIAEPAIVSFLNETEKLLPLASNRTNVLATAIVAVVGSIALTLFKGNRFAILFFLANIEVALSKTMEDISEGKEIVVQKPFQGGQS